MSFDPTDKSREEIKARTDYIDSITMSPAQRTQKVQELLAQSGITDISEWDITCYCAYWLMQNLGKDKHPVYHALQTLMATLHQWHYFECEDWELVKQSEQTGVPLDELKKELDKPLSIVKDTMEHTHPNGTTHSHE